MNFLRNAWYCAAWGREITRKPLARTFLNEQVVMYRKQDGGIIALGNICAHRFAPLHNGKLHGDVLACPNDLEVRTEHDILVDGDSITTAFNQLDTKPFGFVNFVWPDAPSRVSSYSGIRWQAPANMLLKIHFVSLDPAVNKEIRIWGAELVTPETEFTCHYFWSAARDFRLDDAKFGEALKQTIGSVFTNEDAPMIASVQENMGELMIRLGGLNTIAVVKPPTAKAPMGILNHNGLDVATQEEVEEAHRIVTEEKDKWGLHNVSKPYLQHGSFSFYFWDCDENCWEILTNPEGGYSWLFEKGDLEGRGHQDPRFQRPGVKTVESTK